MTRLSKPVSTRDTEDATGVESGSAIRRPWRVDLSNLAGALGWRWPVVGMASTLAMALAAPPLIASHDGPATKWFYAFVFSRHDGLVANTAIFYAGMIMLSVSWLALGRRLRGASPASTCVVGVMWALPLILGPPLFSQDIYSYASQGLLPHIGLNPYVYSPGVLGVWGHPAEFSAVSPIWRSTIAPYGPTFIALASLAVGGASSLVSAVIGLRLLEVAGVGLLGFYVPRLARLCGADGARATWLAVLSPVMLLSLVAAGHNDALMAGIMVAGVTLAMQRRPLLGIALCALAATVKLPGAAGVVFIGVAWARDQYGPTRKVRALTVSAAVATAVFTGVTLATGLGWAWLSPGSFTSTGQVMVTFTPSTALGSVAASVLHALNLGPGRALVVSVFKYGGLAAAGLAGIYLLWRVRMENLVLCLGITLLSVPVLGPVAWPWYLAWSIPLLAAGPRTQHSWALVGVLALFSFVIGPAGSGVITGGAMPLVALGVSAGGIWAWRSWRRLLLGALSCPDVARIPSNVGNWTIRSTTQPSEPVGG